MTYDFSASAFNQYVTPRVSTPYANATTTAGTAAVTTSGSASGVMSSLSAAQNWNLYGSIATGVINIGSSLYGMYQSNKIAKAQARIAKAQARIQANAYAAEAVGYEQTAQRLAQAYGAQEYETIRQQNAYLEDMTVDAAVRGGAMEGTNRYMISEQAREFERGNAYARLANEREQANYMNAASQSMQNARNAILGGSIQARGIRAQEQMNRTAQFINLGSSLLGTTTNYMATKNKLDMQKAYFNLAGIN